MHKFFQNNTPNDLYTELSVFSVGNQTIRQTNALDRLLSGIILDENKAEQNIRDVAERVQGFDIYREFQQQYARKGVVIAPLCDAFKAELADAAESFRLR